MSLVPVISSALTITSESINKQVKCLLSLRSPEKKKPAATIQSVFAGRLPLPLAFSLTLSSREYRGVRTESTKSVSWCVKLEHNRRNHAKPPGKGDYLAASPPLRRSAKREGSEYQSDAVRRFQAGFFPSGTRPKAAN